MNKMLFLKISLLSSIVLLVGTFQNCSKVRFVSEVDSLGKAEACETVSCELTPLTEKTAVTTILMALGDQHNSELIVKGASSQFIAESVVRYTSPKDSPRILLINDYGNNGESPEDTIYVRDVLLSRYNTDFLQETASGISVNQLKGYDVVWYNNPGHPMSNSKTRDALIAFEGGVILQGDDLSWGNGFSLTSLTGLTNIDNGSVVRCGSQSYPHDNNANYQYSVTLDSNKIPGANSSVINFRYGNDIDNSVIARNDLEVLAHAKGGPNDCTQLRPAIVRYEK